MSQPYPIENIVTSTQANSSFADLIHQTKLPIALTGSEAIAALACAEVQKRPRLDPQLLDNLLSQALRENLLYDEWFLEKTECIENLTKLLLPQVKKTLHYFYSHSKNNDVEFNDIVKTTQQECDFDFLQFVTKIYTKAFLREIKSFTSNTIN